MLTIYPPFTIHQAEFALYLADESGNAAAAEVYLGGCLEDLSPETEFVGMRLEPHGQPTGRTIHTDERHKFTVKNLWALQRATNFIPQPQRNQQYAFVVVWYDETNLTWVKRIYLGVTADGQRLPTENQVVKQNIPFTASFMDEDSGLGTKPSLSPVLTGKLFYVTANERTMLYRYDFDTDVFTAVNPALLASRAQIVTDATQFRIDFNGSTALKATPFELQIEELTAIGGTFLLGSVYPRLEFFRGRKRSASLSADGELAVPNIMEVEGEPKATFNDGTRDYTWRPVNGRYVIVGAEPTDPNQWFIDTFAAGGGVNEKATIYEIVADALVGQWNFERINGVWTITSENSDDSLSVPPVIPNGYSFFVSTEPVVPHGFRIPVNGAWVATIGPTKTYAKEFHEVDF